MGNCMFCCLSEDQQVGRILAKFPTKAASEDLECGKVVEVVGRSVLAGDTPQYSPATNTPCVYYNIKIERQTSRDVQTTDANGNRTTQKQVAWKEVITTEKWVDFYIQDGATRIFVNGSNKDHCRFQGNKSIYGVEHKFYIPPKGLQWMMEQLPGFTGFLEKKGSSGYFRYTEELCGVNEMMKGLGVLSEDKGRGMLRLDPIKEDSMTDAEMTAKKWGDFDKKSWHALLSRGEAVLLSDKTDGKCPQVAEIAGLPAHMTGYDPNFSLWKDVVTPEDNRIEHIHINWGDGPGGTWKNSARNVRVEGNKLQADLDTGNGQWLPATTFFAPGDTFDNINGHFKRTSPLQPPGGSWKNSAKNSRVEGNTLHADLDAGNGQWLPATTTFNAGDTFENNGGHFQKK